MTRYDSLPDPEDFFQDLERQSQRYRLHSVRVAGSGNRLAGLFLLARDVALTETDLEEAFARILRSFPSGLAEGDPSAPAADAAPLPASGPEPAKPLQELLAAEIERTRQNRIPCALILLELDHLSPSLPADEAKDILARVVRLVRTAVRRSDLLLQCDFARLAVVLPGISLRQATECAERVRCALAAEHIKTSQGSRLSLTASMGLGLCYADDLTSAELLTEKVTRELERARGSGGNLICQARDCRLDHSCQVSVEERAELFSIFTKDLLP